MRTSFLPLMHSRDTSLYFHKTGRRKSHDIEKNKYLSYSLSKELIFLSMIEACSNFIFIDTYLETPFVTYQY